MVHGQAVGNQRSAIVSDDGEPIMAEPEHQANDVVSHRALGRLSVIRLVRRQRRLPVAAQVRADDGVPLGQLGGHLTPGRVSARVAMEQHHGWTVAAVANAGRDLANFDVIQHEALEHEHSLPRWWPG